MTINMSAEDVAKLYDDIDAKQNEKGVKGEKAGSIREVVRAIVAAKLAQKVNRLSQATLRHAVKDILTPKDAEGKATKDVVIEQSHFTSIIAGMYETEKDPATGAVIVLIDGEKAPKPKKERVRKAKVE